VQQYNAKAHHILETAGFTPKILYSSMEDLKFNKPTELHMVIMEYIEGDNAYEHHGDKLLPSSIFNQVETTLETTLQKLHAANIVFGDLHCPNLLTYDEHVLLFDYNWCSKHNTEKYISNFVEWTPSNQLYPNVEPGRVMMIEHDLFMLNQLRL
jgi:predicted Ser/Thr protein kinase